MWLDRKVFFSDCYAVMFSFREHCYVARQKSVF